MFLGLYLVFSSLHIFSHIFLSARECVEIGASACGARVCCKYGLSIFFNRVSARSLVRVLAHVNTSFTK